MQLEKKTFVLIVGLLIFFNSYTQSQPDTINEKNVRDILTYLASDKLKGRVNYSKEQWDAADFIAKKFEAYGLSPFPGFRNYFQPFSPRTDEILFKNNLRWNGRKLSHRFYVDFSSSLNTQKTGLTNYRVIRIDSLTDSSLVHHWTDTTNVLIWIKKNSTASDTLLPGTLIIPYVNPRNEILVVAAPDQPTSIQLVPNKSFSDAVLYNVVGILPGRSKTNEAIIFCAHYDHIDSDPSGNRFGVFNGANDNASGSTAVLELARYFSMKKDNERTIIFCLFAGEELGLLGSEGFAKLVSPENIKAVINIEMIGRTNALGKEKFFVTGSRFSDLERIITKNLKGEKVQTAPRKADPGNLFQRSDNYPFYQKGIVAHSIMCSDDNDPCYHQTCDTAEKIDFTNMTVIIKAIAKACQTMISAEDTPKKL
ncbi:MAG TPA: M28 family peptidase [Chitinophagaceae bacterium]|jgi:peptidase M28-like protein|nr:M28 family peptidase [Chitinophagaceae bacterium]